MEGNDSAWDLYVPLVSFSAILQAESMLSTLGRAVDRGPHAVSEELPGAREESRWGRGEFKQTAAMLKRAGVFANAGDSGLTAEFPRKAGGVSAIAGDLTGLLTMQADMPHPSWGNGLFFKLELPMDFDDAAGLANRLNLDELHASDAPPFFGAWCGVPQGRGIAFVGFWPNALYHPSSALNVAVWMMNRDRVARTWIGKK